MQCGDCGETIMGTNAEIVAQTNGLLLCEDCVESMEDERDAYERERREAGVECVFDPERGFVMRPIDNRIGPNFGQPIKDDEPLRNLTRDGDDNLVYE